MIGRRLHLGFSLCESLECLLIRSFYLLSLGNKPDDRGKDTGSDEK